MCTFVTIFSKKKADLAQISDFMRLEGKTIWITGASSGIGAALAIESAKKGASLILSARRKEKLEAVKNQCLSHTNEVMVLPMDIADEKSIQSAWQILDTEGRQIDILINNGGVSQRAFAAETETHVVRRIMEVNFFGAVSLTRLVMPGMIERRSGAVIVIGSLSGKFGWKMRSTYAASKFALQGYFESLRAEVAEYGIEVLIAVPGRIKTDISLSAVTNDGGTYNQMDAAQKGGIPAEQCASVILKALENGKKEVVIARMERLMIAIRFLIPGLYYRIAAKRDPNI
jgi:dehydrogenase/reductase SDR family protein 7B